METTKISGEWNDGYILDKHVKVSYPLDFNEYGHMQYDILRTELGELVFQLKNRNKIETSKEIAKISKEFLNTLEWQFDLIVATPPSNKNRTYQPVYEIVKQLGE